MYGKCFTGVGGVSVRLGTCAFRISTLVERMETEFNILLSLPLFRVLAKWQSAKNRKSSSRNYSASIIITHIITRNSIPMSKYFMSRNLPFSWQC